MKKRLCAAVLATSLIASSTTTAAEEKACYLPDEYIEYCFEAQENFGISAALIASMIQVESSARNVKNGNCWGLLQVNTQHVADKNDLMDPEQNIRFGVSVLDECREKAEDDIVLALMYYNGEPNAKKLYNQWLESDFSEYPTTYVCRVLEGAEAIESEWYGK